jgi:hypothetical protein
LKILKELGEILGPNDPKLVEMTLSRLNEQDKWNDVFSTKLIELLDKIDQIKSEIRQRLREADERILRAECVTQEEAVLLEKAKEFGEASRRLELARNAQERAFEAALGAKEKAEEASIALESARCLAQQAQSLADDAVARLRHARDAELRAIRLSHRTVRFVSVAVALSWIAIAWMIRIVLDLKVSAWIAMAFLLLIASATLLFVRRIEDEPWAS